MGKLIFILGCGKSGTELLLSYFRAVQDTIVLRLPGPPVVLYAARKKWGDEKHFVARRTICPEGMGRWGSSFGGTDLYRMDSSMVDAYMPWVDWLEGWRSMAYLHMRRDPRDAVACRPGGPMQGGATVQQWKNAEAVQAQLAAAGAPVRVIAYESLISDGPVVMRALCEALALLPVGEFKRPEFRPRAAHEDEVSCWKLDRRRRSLVAQQLSLHPDLPQLLIQHGYETTTDWMDYLGQ